MTNEDRQIQADRMRFTKNTFSSNLAYLAILFDVFYFVSIYRSDVGSYYYNILTGASIVYNLLFLLAVFLSSEGVKNYKESYSWLLAAIGILQFVRIFIIPARAHGAVAVIGGVEVPVMGNGQYMRLIVFLVVSGVCLLVSAVVNYNKCRTLKAHMKTLDGKIV